MPEIEVPVKLSVDVEQDTYVDIELYCTCGEGICRNATAGKTTGRRQPFFEIEPCEKCLEKARQEGFEAGTESKEEN